MRLQVAEFSHIFGVADLLLQFYMGVYNSIKKVSR